MRCRSVALLAPLFAVALTGCPADDEVLTHGFVQLEMQRGESQSSNPYSGTVQVVATMQYESCLAAFYLANPGLRAEGPEGEKIFGGEDLGGEGWKDRLCEPGKVATQADCEIADIEQLLMNVAQMTITYNISGELEGRRLLFGPIPTKELAECEGNDLPTVRVGSNGAVKGQDASGNQIWQTESFTPPSAATNQGAPIRIGAARND